MSSQFLGKLVLVLYFYVMCVSVNYRVEFPDGPGAPVGQRVWESTDHACISEQAWLLYLKAFLPTEVFGLQSDRTPLVLSVCRLGSQFTCRSGHCIPNLKRCDNIYDCQVGELPTLKFNVTHF